MTSPLTVIQQGFNQVGILVPDLEPAIRRYQSHFGVRQWDVYAYDSSILAGMTYRGRTGNYAMQIALSNDVRGMQVELIQPLSGESIYNDFIQSNGYGFHHFGVFCDTVRETVAELGDHGFPVIQDGWGFSPAGDGYFGYIDTTDALGYIIELRQPPSNRWPPQQTYE